MRHNRRDIQTRVTMLKLTFALDVSCLLLVLTSFAACTTIGGTLAAPTATTLPTSACTAHSSNPVSLTMYYGSEKKAWIDDVVADFNSRNLTACDGPISIKAIPIGSGDSMQQIVNGTIQPDIWSPAGSVWLTLLNDSWQQKHSTPIIPTGATETPSLVSSPVVIAMWKPEAQALGWPNKALGWSDIYNLSTNHQGWAAYGLPQFGSFKFGHTRPDSSNSGLDGVIAENYAGASKVHGLTLDDVSSAATKDFVSSVERSIIYYGDNSSSNSTGFFADKMFTGGPSILSAAVMYESLVVEANDGKTYPHLPYPVVAIYPKEGTFYSDHPFVIPQASWVTPAKRAAAMVFRNFLLAPNSQKKALLYGFRPGNTSIAVAAPIDAAHGVDPNQPGAILQIPAANVVQAIQSSWEDRRHKVDVMLILDRSGSMNDAIGGTSKIVAARQGLAEFVNLLSNSDELGLTTFSNTATVLTPVSLLGAKRQTVLKSINGINADGNTLLFDTIYAQWKALKALPSSDIKVIVVLTDGMDNISQLTIDQVVKDVTPSGPDVGAGLKIFTIAYGRDADVTGLTRIATASGGQEYAGTPQNIRQVYLDISEFF